MKKLFILLAILGLGFSLTGCKHKHELVQHEAKQATCTEDGHNAYEECSECDYTTYVKIEALGHKDEDFDHNCDNNCGEKLGEHVDTNNDHNCDNNCGEKLGEHVDTNSDHNCEYGCEEAIGEHVDTNNDHNCDYCSGTLTECLDEDFDCICDLCDKELDFTFDEETNTYYVRTSDGLYEWAKDYVVKNLELLADVYLLAELIFDADNDGVNDSNWSPVRVNDGVTINGNGFSIEGIKINNSTFCGFSSHVFEQGLVKNLHLKDVSLNGERVGGITANNFGTIINCSVSGEISSVKPNQGGIVGYNNGVIVACVNYANVTSTDGTVGGLVAQMGGGKIIACYNLGNISGDKYIGGIVGSFYSGDIISCYNLGQIYGTQTIGYITGYGAGTFNSNYWIDFEGDNASTANGFRETQEGCTLVDETTTWEVAKVAMNEAIATYNETATIKCEYAYELNSDEDTKDAEPLVLVLQEEIEQGGRE